MKKKLLSLVAATTLIVPTFSHAIGLGSVRIYSNLNERLNAEVPVLSVKKKGRISAGLASNAEFARRGVQRAEILDNLRFSVIKKGGRSYVRISSAKQIAVPYLNFILQIDSPEGVVLREYAIFLDPASVRKGKRGKTIVASPYRKKAQKKNSGKFQPAARNLASIQRTTTAPQQSRRTLNVNISDKKGGRYGPVRKGETLWSIASKTRPSSRVDVGDMVEAIRRANPRTLATTLPAGVMLNIPTIEGYSRYHKSSKPIKKAESELQPESTATNQQNAEAEKTQPNAFATAVPKLNENVTASSTATTYLDNSQTPVLKSDDNESADDMTNVATVNIEPVSRNLENSSDHEESIGNAINASIEDTVENAEMAVNKVTDSAETAVENTVAVADAALETVTSVTHNNLKATGENTVTSTVDGMDSAAKLAAEVVATGTEKTGTTVADNVESAKNNLGEAVTALKTDAESITANAVAQANNTKTPAKSVTTLASSVEVPVTDKIMGFVEENGPAVGGAAALGLGGLFLLGRRRKAQKVAAPSLTAESSVTENIADVDKQAELDLEELLRQLPEEEVSSNDTPETSHLATDPIIDESQNNTENVAGELPDDILALDVEDFGDNEPNEGKALQGVVNSDETNVDLPELADIDNNSSGLDFDLSDDFNIKEEKLIDDIEKMDDTLKNEQLKVLDDAIDDSGLASVDFDLSDGVQSQLILDDETLDFDLTDDANIDALLVEDNSELETFSIGDGSVADIVDPATVDEDNFDLLFDEETLDVGNEVADSGNINIDVAEDTLDLSLDSSNEDADSLLDVTTHQLIDDSLSTSATTLVDDAEAVDVTFGGDEHLVDIDNDLSDNVEFNSSETDVDDLLDLSDLGETEDRISAERMARVTPEKHTDQLLKQDNTDDILFDFDDQQTDDILASIGGNEAVQAENDQVITETLRENISPEAESRMQMKLDLANSFISISEFNRAESLLQEIIKGGSAEQAEMAENILKNLGS